MGLAAAQPMVPQKVKRFASREWKFYYTGPVRSPFLGRSSTALGGCQHQELESDKVKLCDEIDNLHRTRARAAKGDQAPERQSTFSAFLQGGEKSAVKVEGRGCRNEGGDTGIIHSFSFTHYLSLGI